MTIPPIRSHRRRQRTPYVAMVSEHASPLAVLGGVDAGGQNVHVAELARGLARRGVRVVVHTRRDDASLPRRVRFAPNVEVDHVDAGPPIPIGKDELLPHMDEFAEQLARCWAIDPPAVVHSHFWMSGRAALAAALPLDIPLAHTFHALGVVKRRHQGDKDNSPPCRIAEERSIIARADRVLATCSDEVFELTRLGADRRRVHVVPCGVDPKQFSPRGPCERRTDGLHRVVVLGRLVERKGIADAIEALTAVDDTELVVAGGPDPAVLDDDPEACRLRKLAADYGVADRVTFRGRVDRDAVARLLRSADVVVCAPWYEPFGIVPLEAMASGVPVVATAVGGMIDTVVDGVTGLHVPPREPAAIAAAVKALLHNPERRATFGRAGVRRVHERYGWDRVAATTLAAYPVDVRASGRVAQVVS